MRIGITGASGFIGAQLVPLLLDEGHEVVTITRSSAAGTLSPDPQVEQVELALGTAEPGSVASLGLDGCVHLGWHTSPPSYLTDWRQNLSSLRASISLTEGLLLSDCKRFIFAGTCLETCSRRPPYAEAKSMMHTLLDLLSGSIDAVCLHIYNVYGPKENAARLIPTIIRRLLQGGRIDALPGETLRNYVYVTDVAAALALAMASDLKGTADVCFDAPATMDSIYDILENSLRTPGAIRRGAVVPAFDLPASGNAKPLEALGWRPQVTLEEGLARSVRWWSEHG